MFADKLNFLMSIIGVSGGELAHSISLDPSYISRLRRGKRELPKDHGFVEDIARYFSSNIKTDYQKKLLREAIPCEEEWPQDEEGLKRVIHYWLLSKDMVPEDKIQEVIRKVVTPSLVDLILSPDYDTTLEPFPDVIRDHYYGDKGKQLAFLRFLKEALQGEGPQEMILFTNEDFSRLATDQNYERETLNYIQAFLKAGNKIKVIHPISDDADEMAFLMQRWLPVYLVGHVEPYYYPKIQSNLHLRTAYVLPGKAAMTSCSMEGWQGESITDYHEQQRAVASVEAECRHLLALSKPLARVFTSSSREGFEETLRAFYTAPAPTIVLHDHLTPYAFQDSSMLLPHVHKGQTYLEALVMPDLEQIKNGQTPVPFSRTLEGATRHFSLAEYLSNLDTAIDLMKKNLDVHISIIPHSFLDVNLCVKKDLGVVLTRSADKEITFFIDVPQILDAVWAFAEDQGQRLIKGKRRDSQRALDILAASLRS